MAYQGFTEEEGKLAVLLELTGQVICFLYLNQLQVTIVLQHVTL
jgi:hypothetical protein